MTAGNLKLPPELLGSYSGKANTTADMPTLQQGTCWRFDHHFAVSKEDMWNNFKDEHGHRLNIGRLMYVTKHGKQAFSFVNHISLRNVKSALSFVTHLFLAHSKVTEDDSIIQDSLLKVIKNSSKNETIHSNSIDKVNTAIACFVVDFFVYVIVN